MKKLVLAMVFVLLSALFIAFNYLLWDRESREKELRDLEVVNATNNSSINAQTRQIDRLEKEITSLNNKIDQLELDKEQLGRDKSDLTTEKTESEIVMQQKIIFINALKQAVDIKTFSEPVTKWANALNQGKYEEAYELEYAAVPLADRDISLSEYKAKMKKNLHKIEIAEIKLDGLKGSDTGEIFLKVKLAAKLAPGADKTGGDFTEGINEKAFKIDYSADKKTFIIASISSK
jgi:septal ring factor EnvC (AmiA/AmiB activator)